MRVKRHQTLITNAGDLDNRVLRGLGGRSTSGFFESEVKEKHWGEGLVVRNHPDAFILTFIYTFISLCAIAPSSKCTSSAGS